MITKRIKYLMESKSLSAVAFAEKLGIQRSGLSHLFSGRNRPSLDLILKILEVFPDIDPDWLLLGKRDINDVREKPEMQSQNVTSVNSTVTDHPTINEQRVITDVNSDMSQAITDVNPVHKEGREAIRATGSELRDENEIQDKPEKAVKGSVEQFDDEITVLYPDGTYRIYSKRV